MRSIKQFGICGLIVMLLITVVGCPSLDPRTSNQGGGNIITAGAKIAGGNVGDLNPDEWQILTDELSSLGQSLGIDIPSDFTIDQLSDDQAQAIVDVLDQYNINTMEELQAAIDNGTITENDIPAALQDLFT